jgi:hypothetical protein
MLWLHGHYGSRLEAAFDWILHSRWDRDLLRSDDLLLFRVYGSGVQAGAESGGERAERRAGQFAAGAYPGLMWIFGAIAVGLAVVTLTTGLCNLYAGVALRRRRHRIFVMVMAVLNCLAAPYGTVLGIFTLLVLQRPAAKELFAGAVVGPVIL